MDTVPLPAGLKKALPFLGNVELRAQDSWLPELAFAVFVVLFLINIFKGRQSNQHRVLGWATRVRWARGGRVSAWVRRAGEGRRKGRKITVTRRTGA